MTIEEAIKTAIGYETRIYNIYRDAAANVSDPAGKRIIEMLRDDEQRHIEYLKDRLELWKKTGKLSESKLESTIPLMAKIQKETEKVRAHMPQKNRTSERDILSKALKAEVETSKFYQKMVDEMPDEAQRMFARFLEIEENHIAAVQFELDYLTQSGYWLDFKEFDMEEL
jgi:rubrerythrin